MPNQCPTMDELQRYLVGEASSSSFERWDEHIAACVQCQAELEHLGSLSEPLCKLVAEAAQTEAPKLPTDLRTALEQIRQNGPRHKPLVSASEHLSVDDLAQIREYRILACIGEGGMGCVYHAYDTFLQRAVAIKVLRRERLHKKEAVQRFMREMEVIGKLEHPSIVKALAAGEQDGLHYLVMEYIPGVDTYQLRKTMGTFSIADSCEIVHQIARALEYAHGKQVLHRDIKPSNIIINSDGRVILLDLGLAQLFGVTPHTQLSKTDQAIGTLAYMAPEQLAGLRGHSIEADIFSLGATFCEYLTGMKLPLRNANNDLFTMIAGMLPKLPGELLQLLRSMIANSPKDRPRSMSEVVTRIAPFIKGANLQATVKLYQTRMLQGLTSHGAEAVVAPPIQSDVTTDHPNLEHITPNYSSSSRSNDALPKHAVAAPSSSLLRQKSMRRRRAGLAAAAVLLIALPPVVYSFSPWGPFASSWGTAESLASDASVGEPGTTVLVNGAPANAAVPPPVVDEETGRLEISAVDEIPHQLLRDGRVQIENVKSQKRFTLESGPNSLPIGDYRITMNGPEEMETIEGVSVALGAPQKLILAAALKHPFQFPMISRRVGEFCSYHGTIQIASEQGGPKVSYTLRLKVLATEGPSATGISSTWILVEAVTQHPTGDLVESAYLKIETETWEHDKRLKVLEGWVVGSSNSIAQYMQQYFPQVNSKNIVVRFDPNEDLLKKRGAMALPATRVSIHDFLVLFFGDESILAANDVIKKLRPELPNLGKRHTWIDTIDGGRGPIECYIVSSMDRLAAKNDAAMGFFMARSKRAPFGFVELRVNTPMLAANCVVKNSDTTKVDEAAVREEIELIRKSETPNEDVAIKDQRFDLATLPENEGDSSKWLGRLSIGTAPQQNIEAIVTTLGTETVDGVKGRWLNVEVTSSTTIGINGNWENAYVLVDEEAYKQRKFKILKGWIATQNPGSVFAFPTDMDLDAMVDQRITLLESPGLKYIGVPEVLSMLFGAEFKPNSSISSLRDYIGAINGSEARRVSLSQKTLRSGKNINVQTWEPPLNSQIKYNFAISKDVPFGIVDVSLEAKSPASISINFSLNESHSAANNQAAPVPFDTQKWRNLAESTQQQVNEAQKENWRVWEWTRNGKVFKVYAEHCGIIYQNGGDKGTVYNGNSGNILLKNRTGQFLQVSLTDLSRDDIDSLEQGRYWRTSKTEHKWFHLTKFTLPKMTLQNCKTGLLHSFKVSSLGQEDRIWAEQLIETDWDSRSHTREMTQDMQFADYLR